MGITRARIETVLSMTIRKNIRYYNIKDGLFVLGNCLINVSSLCVCGPLLGLPIRDFSQYQTTECDYKQLSIFCWQISIFTKKQTFKKQ